MIHEIEDIEQERIRLVHRPDVDGAPPVLCAFDVQTSGPVSEFDTRLRSVLAPALRLAASQPFEGQDLPVDAIPSWFVAAAREPSGPVPDFARRGAERYAATIGKGTWDLQEWLYQFDPESEFRGWAWWDLTQAGEREARIWVDTWGESFFACDELRWLVYVSGAEEVSGPALVRPADWIAATTP
ncbi:hypothetical protein J7F01_23540 [Streptomyces sp. ISL-22]|uniref:hypothetical protein n=1 Tax=unclassified Streptomyces TaxID=2593676 RepID=UPI001BEAF04D|nr:MULTISPECIES: hypothetical protein [unclassified Streptomyces]MBT2421531.1 hypothetical protein [Streptomyces sp. ISL-24]MBT2435089.1 hypothetical protein [Streptomyces sp. ISL-22]